MDILPVLAAAQSEVVLAIDLASSSSAPPVVNKKAQPTVSIPKPIQPTATNAVKNDQTNTAEDEDDDTTQGDAQEESDDEATQAQDQYMYEEDAYDAEETQAQDPPVLDDSNEELRETTEDGAVVLDRDPILLNFIIKFFLI